VRGSLVFSNCYVHSYAEVTDSVILPDVDVGERARIHRAIIDRGCQIPEGMEIGVDHAADRERGLRVTKKGVPLVTPELLGQQLHYTR